MPDLIAEGVTQSFEIPEQNFGMTYHALMIPPFPMRSALFLGYGEGNVPALMDKVWPVGCEITGVDIHSPKVEPQIFFKREAWQFVEWSEKVYDFVCVDIYKGKRIPDFVFSEKFVDGLAKITGKMLALNCTFYNFKDAKIYDKHFDVDAVKIVNEDRVLFMLPRSYMEKRKKPKHKC